VTVSHPKSLAVPLARLGLTGNPRAWVVESMRKIREVHPNEFFNLAAARLWRASGRVLGRGLTAREMYF
jgi:hypothetical protein